MMMSKSEIGSLFLNAPGKEVVGFVNSGFLDRSAPQQKFAQ